MRMPIPANRERRGSPSRCSNPASVGALATTLQQAWLDPEVLARHSDYQVLLMTAENLAGGPSDDASNAALEGRRGSRPIPAVDDRSGSDSPRRPLA